MVKEFTVKGNAIPKPRQTRRDRWAKRPCVMRYREWADTIRTRAGMIAGDPWGIAARAYFTIPASYSKKKRNNLPGQRHRVKPDADNVLKGISDALFKRDQEISLIYLEKFWDDGKGARTEIVILGTEDNHG